MKLKGADMTKAIFALSLMLLSLGCASTKVTSNRSPDFQGGATSLLLAVKTSPVMSTRYASELARQFRSDLASRRVEVDTLIVSGVHLEDVSPEAIAQQSRAPLVLLLTQTGAMLYPDSAPAGTVFDATLVEVATMRPVWRASLTSKFNYRSSDLSLARSLSNNLAKQLIQDGIVAE